MRAIRIGKYQLNFGKVDSADAVLVRSGFITDLAPHCAPAVLTHFDPGNREIYIRIDYLAHLVFLWLRNSRRAATLGAYVKMVKAKSVIAYDNIPDLYDWAKVLPRPHQAHFGRSIGVLDPCQFHRRSVATGLQHDAVADFGAVVFDQVDQRDFLAGILPIFAEGHPGSDIIAVDDGRGRDRGGDDRITSGWLSRELTLVAISRAFEHPLSGFRIPGGAAFEIRCADVPRGPRWGKNGFGGPVNDRKSIGEDRWRVALLRRHAGQGWVIGIDAVIIQFQGRWPGIGVIRIPGPEVAGILANHEIDQDVHRDVDAVDLPEGGHPINIPRDPGFFPKKAVGVELSVGGIDALIARPIGSMGALNVSEMGRLVGDLGILPQDFKDIVFPRPHSVIRQEPKPGPQAFSRGKLGTQFEISITLGEFVSTRQLSGDIGLTIRTAENVLGRWLGYDREDAILHRERIKSFLSAVRRGEVGIAEPLGLVVTGIVAHAPEIGGLPDRWIILVELIVKGEVVLRAAIDLICGLSNPLGWYGGGNQVAPDQECDERTGETW